MTERWRVFCAVEIPKEVRARVVEYIAQLRKAAPAARASWAREEALHITLKFLGEVDSNRVPVISKAAELAAQHLSPFSLSLEDTGTFPSTGPTRVLWIGITDPTGNLSKLQEIFENECALEGFSREQRSFHPHLTIARQRAPQGARTPAVLQTEPQFPRIEFAVNELVVMRSELRPEGSRYTRLSSHGLDGD